jgi:hypothetical protein
MTKREKIAALLRMTVDRGCTSAEAETARRLAAKLLAERAPTGTIARRFDPPVPWICTGRANRAQHAAGAEIGTAASAGARSASDRPDERN